MRYHRGDLPTGARLNRECIGVLQCVSTDQVHIAAELHAAYLILRRGSAKQVHAAVLFQTRTSERFAWTRVESRNETTTTSAQLRIAKGSAARFGMFLWRNGLSDNRVAGYLAPQKLSDQGEQKYYAASCLKFSQTTVWAWVSSAKNSVTKQELSSAFFSKLVSRIHEILLKI